MNDRLTRLLKLHQAEPDDAFVAYGIALEYTKTTQPDQVIAWLDKTLAIDAHYHYAYFQKARALSELGRTDDARQTLAQGIDQARQADDYKALGELSELLKSL